MTHLNGWPKVTLGEVLKHRKEFVQIDDLAKYKRCRVQLHAQGVVLRDIVEGSQIKTKTQQVCGAQEFLVAEIDAKMGGFGIVPEELHGAIVSSHYFLFVPDRRRLDPRFLAYYAKTPQFREQVAARGTTNYAAIRPGNVLAYTLPLPPLEEQQRIAGKIHRVVAKIDQARRLRMAISDQTLTMLRGTFARVASKATISKMRDVAPLVRRRVQPKGNEGYPELGIRSFGKGTFHKPVLESIDVGSKKLYRIAPGDLLFNNVFAWEGAIAVAQPEDVGRVGSHRFITCVPKPGVTTADFLCFYFLTPEGLDKIGKASPGGAGRNRTLGLEKLADIDVPVPTYESQLRFDRLQQRVKAMVVAHQDQMAKLDAMVPSILDRAFMGAM
jgi:type I restriction enzyme S subunit